MVREAFFCVLLAVYKKNDVFNLVCFLVFKKLTFFIGFLSTDLKIAVSFSFFFSATDVFFFTSFDFLRFLVVFLNDFLVFFEYTKNGVFLRRFLVFLFCAVCSIFLATLSYFFVSFFNVFCISTFLKTIIFCCCVSLVGFLVSFYNIWRIQFRCFFSLSRY